MRASARALALTLLLVLAAAPAWALGLGQIEVKSQRDQPLLAEIRIISSSPGELDQLQARLASPDTFARIGLAPPQGIVSDLQFAVALDAQGNPVIRVTSDAPVQQSLLTFLVEVDWGQGRLVREYSALLDAPHTVSAPAQPSLEAPVVAPSSTIVREPGVAAAEPAGPATGGEGETAAAATSPANAAPMARPSTPAAAPGEYGPVGAGETLGQIAQRMRADGESLDQAIVALFRANPEAFIAGNLNLVRQGAVLRVPAGDERTRYSAAEATALVRAQVTQWREMRRPAPQPEAVAAGEGTAADDAPGAAAGHRVAGARLEIVPPSTGSGQHAGTRSGIDAGGEGEMLRQELQQKDEALAARGAEVEELKARVADLEKLQAQQQQLISLKDSELAAAQQRLAESNAGQPTAAGTSDGATAASDSGFVWIGIALLAAGLVAWWALRRRQRPQRASRVFDTATMAAAVPGKSASVPSATPGLAAAPEAAPRSAVAAPSPPTWHAAPATEPPRVTSPAVRAPSPAAVPAPPGSASAETSAGPGAGRATSGHAAAAPDAAPAGHERLELARAYIDLGDTDTARTLLAEVADSGHADVRDEAARLLRHMA